MTTSPRIDLAHARIATVDDLTALWTTLVDAAPCRRRTLYFILLDEAGHPAPVLVPIDDVPERPGPADVDGLRTVLAGLADLGTPALLLARPGPAGVGDDDRRWARLLTPLAPRWPIHLAVDGGSGSLRARPLDLDA